MKKLFIVLSLAFVSHVHAAPVIPAADVLNDPNADRLVPLKSDLSQWGDRTGTGESNLVTDAKKLALEILEYVKKKEGSKLAVQMIDGLSKADVMTPPRGFDFGGCEKGVLAYVMGRYDGKIRLCNVTVSGRFKTDYVAQVLIHETTHVVGCHDECLSTKIEVAIMRASPLGLVFRNGYWESCGIH